VSLRIKLVILFLVASFLPFAVVGTLLYLDNPQILGKLIYFGALMIIFVVFLGLVLSQIVTDPIKNLILATRAVRGRNLSARVPVTSKDEIGELANGFNQMMNELEQTDKLKTEFVSLASHHLRTPLTSIRWHLETLIAEGRGLTDEQTAYLKEAYAGTGRMVELVNALLDASRLEMGSFVINPKPVNISQCVKDVLKDLETKTQQKSITITTDLKLGRGIIKLNPEMLRIILQNLLDNALDYTPDKGRIELKIDNQDGNILIKVIDSGYGIPLAEQTQIFNKLYRASNVRLKIAEGFGLGLYNVKAMVEQAKGKIWFDSIENKGTTFYVKLPLYGGGGSQTPHAKRNRQKNG
jgi:signal transduction histidine kinase